MQINLLALVGVFLIFDVVNSIFSGVTLTILGAGTTSHMTELAYQIDLKYFVFTIIIKISLALLFFYNFFTKDKKKNK